MYVLRLLDVLEKLEARLADLYEWYASVFSSDAEAVALFSRLSIDEIAHVNLVKYLRRVASQNLKLFGDISFDIETLEAMLANVDSLRSGPEPSLQDAVRVALSLESSASEAHYIPALEQTVSIVGQVMNNLGNFDLKHWGTIEEFAARREFPFASGKKPPATPQPPSRPEHREAGGESTPIPQETLEKMEYYYEWHSTMDFYKILDIKDYASGDQIKKAFRELAQEFHPDRYMNAPKEQMRKLNAVFGNIANAYVTLINPVKRQEYDKTVSARPRR